MMRKMTKERERGLRGKSLQRAVKGEFVFFFFFFLLSVCFLVNGILL